MPGVIAITGLRTFLGRRLARRLAAGGRPRIVGIDHVRPHGLPSEIDCHRIDLMAPDAGETLAECFHKESVETVVHLAFRQEPSADLEADHELDAIGSMHVLHAAAAAGVGRVVVESSTRCYGPRPDNPNFLTEEHPLRGHPDDHAMQDRIEVERLLTAWQSRHPDIAVTVLRPCWMLGPEAAHPVARYLARSVVPMLMGYDPLIQLVHEDDVLAVFEQAARMPHPGTFNVVAPGVVPLSVLLRSAGKRVLPVPHPFLHRLRDFPSQTLTGDPPAGFYDYLRYLWVADGTRGWAEFGRPLYDTRETWAAFVGARRLRSMP